MKTQTKLPLLLLALFALFTTTAQVSLSEGVTLSEDSTLVYRSPGTYQFSNEAFQKLVDLVDAVENVSIDGDIIGRKPLIVSRPPQGPVGQLGGPRVMKLAARQDSRQQVANAIGPLGAVDPHITRYFDRVPGFANWYNRHMEQFGTPDSVVVMPNAGVQWPLDTTTMRGEKVLSDAFAIIYGNGRNSKTRIWKNRIYSEPTFPKDVVGRGVGDIAKETIWTRKNGIALVGTGANEYNKYRPLWERGVRLDIGPLSPVDPGESLTLKTLTVPNLTPAQIDEIQWILDLFQVSGYTFTLK